MVWYLIERHQCSMGFKGFKFPQYESQAALDNLRQCLKGNFKSISFAVLKKKKLMRF